MVILEVEQQFLTIRSVVDKPIKFIGTSEKMDGLDVFHPDRML